jgi:ABC-type transport system involved in multi-copper enzyme maturation permease subunit
MFLRVVAFELRYQIRQPLLWGTAAIFAALSFIATITDAVAIGGAIGSLNRNAPYVVVRMLGDLSLVGVFIVVAFVATSVLRDFEQRTDELVFSRPVRVRDLLFGRFVGSVIAVCGCFACAAVGLFVGSLMPWLEPQRVGPHDLRPYLYGLVIVAFPNFVALGGVLFALASRVRHVAAVYVALVAIVVAYFSASAMFGDLESQRTAAFLDPFGLTAFGLQTRYWTIAEKNSRLPPAMGDVIGNRLLWLALGLSALVWAVGRFRYERAARPRPGAGRAGISVPSLVAPIRWIRKRPSFSASTPWGQFLSQLRLETRAVLWSLPFVLILAFGLINVLANIGYLDLMMGTPVWPVTHLMLLAISSGYSFLLVVIITFFAGEMVWRERNLRIEGLFDASPVPTWAPVLAKLFALWAAAAVFIAGGMVGLMGYQLSLGYTHLQPVLYAQGLVVELVPFLLIAALAICLQVLVNQKFVGYLLMVLYLVGNGVLAALHFDHYLYRYAGAPAAPYSDMNGWGHFVAPVFWFNVYWAFGAGVLVCLACAGWVRGYESRWRSRWRAARARLRGSALAAVVLLLAGFAATGSFIFYNTNVLNAYVASDVAERRQAEYEKKYRQYRDLPQPRVVSVRADVDIFPRERRADIRGSYRLANQSGTPISALHIGVPRRVKVLRLDLPPHRVVLDDRRLGYAIYELATPLAPGQQITFGFHLEISNAGFANNDPDNTVVENGTFFHTRQFPSLGYLDYRELGDPAQRRRQGLPPAIRMAKIDDLRARATNDLARDADWLDFEATLSTDADQIALAPGSLQREWTEGGRRYFHYKMDAAIPKFFAFLSARYAVRRDSWQGVDIAVFYHPAHEYNVGRMIDAVKKTLAYMTGNFSPYQDHQVRIAEFPRYARLAGSFPSIIPFSESIGFIARLKSRNSIDYPFYVTAHEVAHQWWGYQVLGADVQGSAMLSETMAQYSALMVMKQEYGAEQMRRFLKYELDRYLRGRGGELVEEMPLELVEDQPYIHYSKGSLALYALQDSLGEARLNDALRRYIASVRFHPPPYTVSRDLLAFVAEVTPPEKRRLLDDLFASITLFDNQAVSAVSHARADGRYDVTLTSKARKLRSDGQGVETEVPLDDWIDVGIFGETSTTAGTATEKVLYLQKQHVTGPDVTVTTVVDGPPVRAGIDPFNILIDRTPGDNVRAVTRR